MVIAGIGLRRGCPAEAIVAVVRRAEQEAGVRVTALAAPEFKRGETGLRQAATALSLQVIEVSSEALAAAQARTVTRSAAAVRAVGVASVAEGSALAAAGPGGRLLLARISDRVVTCAVAAAGP